jgi:O-antigen/teichoic acid export membrane protein
MKKIILGALLSFVFLAKNALAVCTLNGEVVPCDQIPKWPFVLLGVFFLLIMVGLIFWVIMIIDVAKNEKNNDLIIWMLVLFFFSIIGAIIYYFVRKRGRKNKITNKSKKTIDKK